MNTTPLKPNRHLAHIESFSNQPIVFLTVTTHTRQRILDNAAVQENLVAMWDRSAAADGWFVGDYLLMPDHVHLFARQAVGAKTVAEWVKLWKSISARHIVKTLGVKSPIWQTDYFDRFLRTGESYRDKWEYVELNPVRAGLVAKAEDWVYKGRIHDLAF